MPTRLERATASTGTAGGVGAASTGVTGSGIAGDWATRYASCLLVTDTLVVVWAVFGSQVAWFGLAETNVTILGRYGGVMLSYTVVSVALSLLWILFISGAGTRDSRVVGVGAAEYARILRSSLMLFGLIAIASYLAKAQLARGYFVTALPLGIGALLLTRWMWRQYLVYRRASGGYSSRVVIVGGTVAADVVARDLIGAPSAGYTVVGAFTPAGDECVLPGTGVRVLGAIDDVERLIDDSGADTVVVASGEGLPPGRVRQLSWALEPGRKHLVLSPNLIDIAGPRIHMRPVAGLSLIHVETPRYEGSRQAVKRVFDLAASAALLLVLSVPLLLIAAAVRLSTPGPVLFRQPRVGRGGASFDMLKFRSMVPDAEALLAELRARQTDVGNDVMFKMADDPRITPIGRVLRRYSLDELPQLINVLRGEMSLVGPRPPLPREVAEYDTHVNRRFLVKPGITGLWQVSGRSNLDWDATVRLDLYYVENWSLTGDLVILWRTLRAVLASDGAY
ncbi:MAG: sugar transferase [Microbacteriaceae bacterium]